MRMSNYFKLMNGKQKLKTVNLCVVISIDLAQSVINCVSVSVGCKGSTLSPLYQSMKAEKLNINNSATTNLW
jgi:hypothetical protein